MAQEQIIVSPGVFTQERDQTFLAQGIAEIGVRLLDRQQRVRHLFLH